jgi:hypothetical protein
MTVPGAEDVLGAQGWGHYQTGETNCDCQVSSKPSAKEAAKDNNGQPCIYEPTTNVYRSPDSLAGHTGRGTLVALLNKYWYLVP